MTTNYCQTREELTAGSILPQLSNAGGELRVLRVNTDGSVFGRSDFGANRTVSAEKVDRMLDLAKAFNR